MIEAVNFFNIKTKKNKGLNIFNAKDVLEKSETATDTNYN